MGKYNFNCSKCGCEQMIEIHKGCTIHSRISDFVINEDDATITYVVKERSFMTQKPEAYACEACGVKHAFTKMDLVAEARRSDKPTLLPVVEPSGQRFWAAARLLRKKVLEMYDDAVDRGCEAEISDLGNALKVASEAGIHDYPQPFTSARTGRTSIGNNIEEI